MAAPVPSKLYAAAREALRANQLVLAAAKLEEARVHYVEGDSVTMTMIKTELERVLTRMSLDPYAVLGVASDVADAAAKKAYRKLILKYHPDKNAATASVFRAIQEAYDIVSDPTKRRDHDRKSRYKSRGGGAPPPPPGRPPQRSRRASTGSWAGAGAKTGGSYTNRPGASSNNSRSGYTRPSQGSAWSSRPQTARPTSGGSNSSRRTYTAPGNQHKNHKKGSGGGYDYDAAAKEFLRKQREEAQRKKREAAAGGGGSSSNKSGSSSRSSSRGRQSSSRSSKNASNTPGSEHFEDPTPAAGTRGGTDGSSYSYTYVRGERTTTRPNTSRSKASNSSSNSGSSSHNNNHNHKSSSNSWDTGPKSPKAEPIKVPPERPGKPSVVNRSDSSITVQWERPTQRGRYFGVAVGVTAFELQYRLYNDKGSAASWTTASTRTVAATGTQKMVSTCVSGLKPASSYEFRVRAGSAAGWSAFSAESMYTTNMSHKERQKHMQQQAEEVRRTARERLEKQHEREVARAKERIKKTARAPRPQTARASSSAAAEPPMPRTPETARGPDGRFKYRGAARRASYVQQKQDDEVKRARNRIKERARQRMARQQYGGAESAASGSVTGSAASAAASSASASSGGSGTKKEKKQSKKENKSKKDAPKVPKLNLSGIGGGGVAGKARRASTARGVAVDVSSDSGASSSSGSSDSEGDDAAVARPGSGGSGGGGQGKARRGSLSSRAWSWVKKRVAGETERSDSAAAGPSTPVKPPAPGRAASAAAPAASSPMPPPAPAPKKKSTRGGNSSSSSKAAPTAPAAPPPPSSGGAAAGASKRNSVPEAKPPHHKQRPSLPKTPASRPPPTPPVGAGSKSDRGHRARDKGKAKKDKKGKKHKSKKDQESTGSRSTSEGPCWYEMWDMDYNCAYYVHSDTGESRWEPPLWVQEYDDSTGYYYYLNSYTGLSQWEMPSDFVPVVKYGEHAGYTADAADGVTV